MVMMIVMGIAQGEYGVKRESQGEQAKERWATELGICHVQYSTCMDTPVLSMLYYMRKGERQKTAKLPTML